MSTGSELQTLRTRVGHLESTQLQVLRVEGADGFDALDAIIPRRMFLQDAQVTQTLLLAEDATIVADVQVARDDEAFFLLCETLPGLSAVDLVRDRFPAGCDATVRDLSPSHAVWSVHGPWAWEFLGEALAEEVIGQPYLSFQHVAGVTCFRGGQTGEFGYDLLIPKERVDATVTRLREVGRRYELGPLSFASLDRAALENWFHCIRFEVLWPYTPLELQQQWRLWPEKTGYVGAAALAAKRARGVTERLTTLLASAPMTAGSPVTLEGERVGQVLLSAPVSRGEGHLAWAMVSMRYAVAGLQVAAGAVPALTVSPPVVNNESLRLDTNKHSFRYQRLPA